MTKTRLADTETPVSIYLKLRDRFPETLLLEHSDRSQPEHGFSYICCEPIAGIVLSDDILTKRYLNGEVIAGKVEAGTNVVDELDDYVKSISTDTREQRYSVDGLFGYFSYNAVRHFEQIDLITPSKEEKKIPDIRLSIYRYVIVFDHYRNEIHIVHFYCDDNDRCGTEGIESFIGHKHIAAYPFRTTSEERSNFDDEAFLATIEKGRQHCYRGDVFQVVLSREFEVSFSGDELNVYRALRSINPSQYLFYFDYSSYRLFGSSPEAQLKIKSGKATVHPIAGTYRRTGDSVQDGFLAKPLKADKKEDAEHMMLIDLARNDLSKNYRKVEVPVFKNIQFFSHVMHIVSEVTGEQLIDKANAVKVLADTFPSGTLSGAPKHQAIQLIDRYENSNRGFYGGSLGYVGFNGDLNQAIMIRSFFSKNNTLYYRAGAGIVAASVSQSELVEVNNKIAALRSAIQIANSL